MYPCSIPLPQGLRQSRLLPLLAIAALFAGCQDVQAPTPLVATGESALLSQSPGHPLKGRIVFHSSRDGDFEIFVMNADGTGQTQLTHNTSFEFDPVWSPNGQEIAFMSCGTVECAIYIMSADGSDIRRVVGPGDGVLFAENANAQRVTSWSPDGKHIAFHSQRDGDEDVYVMNADGSGVVQLTHDAGFAFDAVPSWISGVRRLR